MQKIVRKVTNSAKQCNEPYAENDIIPILPTLPTDIARLNLRLKTLREKSLTHALKKAPGSKKRKKGAVAAPSAETTNGTNGVSTTTASQTNGTTQPSSKKKESREATPTTTTTTTPSSNNGIKNASTASLTRKVLEEQEQRNKRRKMMENDNVKSLFSHSKNKPDLKASADYMTRGFSIGKK